MPAQQCWCCPCRLQAQSPRCYLPTSLCYGMAAHLLQGSTPDWGSCISTLLDCPTDAPGTRANINRSFCRLRGSNRAQG